VEDTFLRFTINGHHIDGHLASVSSFPILTVVQFFTWGIVCAIHSPQISIPISSESQNLGGENIYLKCYFFLHLISFPRPYKTSVKSVLHDQTRISGVIITLSFLAVISVITHCDLMRFPSITI